MEASKVEGGRSRSRTQLWLKAQSNQELYGWKSRIKTEVPISITQPPPRRGRRPVACQLINPVSQLPLLSRKHASHFGHEGPDPATTTHTSVFRRRFILVLPDRGSSIRLVAQTTP